MVDPSLQELNAGANAYVANQVEAGVDADNAAVQYRRDLFAMARDKSSTDLTSMPWLPQVPEFWAYKLYDEIEQAERSLVAPNLEGEEYAEGTAAVPNGIVTIEGNSPSRTLFTAEHATETIRKATGKLGYADIGTGGLTAVLSKNHGTGLVMVGRQNSNAATDPNHPIKAEIVKHLPTTRGFLSVHGMAGGKFIHKADRTEIQASIGLGAQPTERMRDLASDLVRVARENYELYVVVGNDDKFFIQKPNSTEIQRNDDNSPYRGRLAALGENSTTNFVRKQTKEKVPALQIELTSFLRLMTVEDKKRDRAAQIIGVALGYKLFEEAARLMKVFRL